MESAIETMRPGRASSRLAELQSALGEPASEAMPPQPAGGPERPLQTALLAGGALGFAAMLAVLSVPFAIPCALAALGAAYCAWQSFVDDARRRTEIRDEGRARWLFEREERAHSQLRVLRKRSAMRAYASFRLRARAGGGSARRPAAGEVVVDELSQSDLRQFFRSLNHAAHAAGGASGHIPQAAFRAGVRDGQFAPEEIAGLFGVSGNHLFISEGEAAD
ncbi:hypothetical protein [Chromobacterium sp. CV08]|uniref:hypothetical protein n=1 Tax=Chromobacterium sp. CV08 TaxID=3133274 RepID=UPI003DA7C9D8